MNQVKTYTQAHTINDIFYKKCIAVNNCKINKEDKVGIFMLNCAEFVFSILAIHKTGAIQVPINKDEKGDRLAYVVNYSEMKVLMIDETAIELLSPIADKFEKLEKIFCERLKKEIGDFKMDNLQDESGKDIFGLIQESRAPIGLHVDAGFELKNQIYKQSLIPLSSVGSTVIFKNRFYDGSTSFTQDPEELKKRFEHYLKLVVPLNKT